VEVDLLRTSPKSPEMTPFLEQQAGKNKIEAIGRTGCF
jgi:hypothetical protein